MCVGVSVWAGVCGCVGAGVWVWEMCGCGQVCVGECRHLGECGQVLSVGRCVWAGCERGQV